MMIIEIGVYILKGSNVTCVYISLFVDSKEDEKFAIKIKIVRIKTAIKSAL